MFVGGARACGVLVMMPAYWCVMLVLGLVLAHCWVEPSITVSGCGSWGFLELVLTFWWAKLVWWSLDAVL